MNTQPSNSNTENNQQITSNACGAELPQKQIVKTALKKEQSDSYKKIQLHRDQINPNSVCLFPEDLSSVVYLYESRNGKPCAKGYRGRAKKQAFNYSYASDEKRLEAVTKWMQDRSDELTEKDQVAKERKSTPRALEVGDVLKASWGWEQTNIDYYKVVELVGKSSVKVVEIGSITDYNSQNMSGYCWPNPDDIQSEPFTRRVTDGDCIKVSFTFASKEEYTIEDDKRVYPKSYYSCYA